MICSLRARRSRPARGKGAVTVGQATNTTGESIDVLTEARSIEHTVANQRAREWAESAMCYELRARAERQEQWRRFHGDIATFHTTLATEHRQMADELAEG